MAGMRVEVRPDEGRAMRSSPLRRQARPFGRRHSQPTIDFLAARLNGTEDSPKRSGIRRMSAKVAAKGGVLWYANNNAACERRNGDSPCSYRAPGALARRSEQGTREDRK